MLPRGYYWCKCPHCGNPKMQMLRQDIVLVNFLGYCKRCKIESIITIEPKRRVVFTYRGDQRGHIINIYLSNIKSKRVGAQTIIHEMTHYHYGIGQCQHAEAVCFAMEKMHILNRSYLTEEWNQMVKLAVDNYPELEWENGGYGDYEQFDFVRRNAE